MSVTPPLGGEAPPLQCNRLLSGAFDAPEPDYCGKPGKWHIMWTPDLENGIACEGHYQEAKKRWAYYAAHEYRMECSMPGAVYLHDENRCVVDEDGLGLRDLVAAESLSAT